MSKLAKAIDYSRTGNVSALSNFQYQYTDVRLLSRQTDFVKEYKIEVKLSATKWFDDNALINSNENESAIKQEFYSSIKREMIEEIFGEFRPIIIELQSAIYDKNLDRMRRLTAELEHKMFIEGV